ncbi:MAG: phenylalanine 4-monooxygenase, partial [Gammaproteobacteria bacterium]|nr:phenylalanine 4-monooxygenase [Gammaproteobacteria bacterium]
MNATQYVARKPDTNGVIHYSDEENAIWHTLIERQLACVEGRACDEYVAGLARLALPHDRIPQLDDINRVLSPATGWQVSRVPALISFDRFFKLLASRRFPVATFIRSRQELDYLQEPDVFHELFGHCALLTNPAFAR